MDIQPIKLTDNERVFQLSSELFWGYQMIIDCTHMKSFDNIVSIMKSQLMDLFRKNNLVDLMEKVKKMKLHSHEFSSIDEVLKKTNTTHIIYICDHCFNDDETSNIN